MAKYELALQSSLMNAAGFLGFHLDVHQTGQPELGAFVTNPVSFKARLAARQACCLVYPGGFLLHSGYPNPGLRAVLSRHARYWQRSPVPVIVHLLGGPVEEVVHMARRLESVPGVAGIELGLPPGTSAGTAVGLAQAVMGELPVILRLPFETCLELARQIAGASLASEITAFSLAAPRGRLPFAGQAPVGGRLYGPGVFPQAVALVHTLAGFGVPVIAAGGVYSASQAEVMRAAGAWAVQLDSVLWRGGWS